MDTFVGRSLDLEQVPFNQSSWAAFDSSVPYILSMYPASRRLIYSVPLPNQFNVLADFAAGTGTFTPTGGGTKTFDASMTAAAQAILAHGYNAANSTKVIFIRFAWEMNFSGQSGMRAMTPDGSAPDYANYIAAFRRFVNLFRSVSNRFVFDFCSIQGQASDLVDPQQCYPGDAYVDIISQDVYYQSQFAQAALTDGSNGGSTWDYFNGLDRGPTWAANFAAARGKRFALTEWGVNHNGAPGFATKVVAFLRAKNAVYGCYWNSDGDIACKVSNGNLPAVGAVVKTAF